MEQNDFMDYAVITGDVINSSVDYKNKQKELLKKIKAVYRYLQSAYKEEMPYHIDIFRGDSFQFIIANSAISLRLATAFWLYAKGNQLEVKISLGFGEIDYLKKTKISESNGEAFLLSGKGLEGMSAEQYINIEIKDQIRDDCIQAYVELLNIYLNSLSEKNALAVFGRLIGLSLEESVPLWPQKISTQSISKHRKLTFADKLLISIELIDKTLMNIDGESTS